MKNAGVMNGLEALLMYTPNAAYNSTDTTSIHHAMYEKNRVRNDG